MKIKYICHECLDNEAIQHVLFSVRDDGIHKVTCIEGHVSFIFLSNSLFEILFDYGLHALNDGYTREAVASFTASIERFYEFYTRIIQRKHGVASDEIDNSWKHVSKMSERQLGGFVSLYLIEKKTAVKLFPDWVTKFRNEVTHKGKIPTEEEAVKYGTEIFSFLKENLNELKRENDSILKAQIKQDLDDNVKKNTGATRRHQMQITTTFLSHAPLEYSLAPTTFQAAKDLANLLLSK